MQKIFLTLAAVCLSLTCLASPAFADDSGAACAHEALNMAYEIGYCDSSLQVTLVTRLTCTDCGKLLSWQDRQVGMFDSIGIDPSDYDCNLTFNGIPVSVGEAWQLAEEAVYVHSEQDGFAELCELNGQYFVYVDEYDAYVPLALLLDCMLPNTDLTLSEYALLADMDDAALDDMLQELNAMGYDVTPASPAAFALLVVESGIPFVLSSSKTSLVSGVTQVFTAVIGWAGTVASVVASQPLLLMGLIFGFLGIGIGLFRRISVK